MLHHVALEVGSESIRRETEMWVLLGFSQVSVPESLGPGFTWVERAGTQIHLLAVDDPVVPARGHVAVVVGDFDLAIASLSQAGFEPREGRQLWGERRAKVRSPAGHLVELMVAPPASASG